MEERARVFRTVGTVRIIGNLTLLELITFVGIFMFAMQATKLPVVPKLIVSVGSAVGSYWIYDTLRHLFPGAAAKHLSVWLAQADRYYPAKDPVSRPLIYSTKPSITVHRVPSED